MFELEFWEYWRNFVTEKSEKLKADSNIAEKTREFTITPQNSNYDLEYKFTSLFR